MQSIKNEDIVYNAIQDYLSKNKTLKVNDIIPYLRSRLSKIDINVNTEGIITIVQSLINKKLIVEGTILTKDIILNTPKRKIIYEYVKNNPGVYLQKIFKDLNYSNHAVIWHINMLLEFKFISKGIVDCHTVYFEPSVDLKRIKLYYYLNNEKSQKIIQFLKINRSGCSKAQILSQLDMHPKTVTKYIDSLLEIGVIMKESAFHKDIYYIKEGFSQ